MYNTWSKYDIETEGIFIAYASIHGGTAEVAHKMAELLREKGAPKVSVADLSRDDMAEAVEDAFRMSNLVLAASSYDAGIFPPMNDFLHHLQDKSFQNRRVALIENGSWAPVAGKLMYAKMKDLKDIDVIEPIITIRGRMKSSDIALLEGLAEVILDK